MKIYDVIVVGGGPSGATCALLLARRKLNVLLIDSKKFPRDKPCGDAIGGDSLRLLKEFGLFEGLQALPHATTTSFVLSGFDGVPLTFSPPSGKGQGILNYVCPRLHFDNLLFQAAKGSVETKEQTRVSALIWEEGVVRGVVASDPKGSKVEYRATVVVGADGNASLVARNLGIPPNPDRHTVISIRAYYSGVEGLQRADEIHFCRESKPGYLWVFPLPNGMANIGIGVLKHKWKGGGSELKKRLENTLATNPLFRDRLRNAKQVSPVSGCGLPLASHRRKLAHPGAVLIGDAGGLIEPLTGEGISFGMRSAEIAAPVIERAVQKREASEAVLKAYADEFWKTFGGEYKRRYLLQKIMSQEWAVNWLMRRAQRRPEVRDSISQFVFDPQHSQKGQLLPFLWKLFLA